MLARRSQGHPTPGDGAGECGVGLFVALNDSDLLVARGCRLVRLG